MVWVISLVLCVALVVAMLGVLFPEIVLPILTRIWDRDGYYFK